MNLSNRILDTRLYCLITNCFAFFVLFCVLSMNFTFESVKHKKICHVQHNMDSYLYLCSTRFLMICNVDLIPTCTEQHTTLPTYEFETCITSLRFMLVHGATVVHDCLQLLPSHMLLLYQVLVMFFMAPIKVIFFRNYPP